MLFNSVHFFFFAPVVVFIYYMLSDRGKRYWILGASLYFYAVFRLPYIVLLLFAILVTYASALQIEQTSGRLRRLWLFIGIFCNASLLFFFKYADFIIHSTNLFFGFKPCTENAIPALGVVLPMGVSFFTIQAIGYIVDVYRMQIPATRSLFDFALFLSFFPHLVAGPILRAKTLIYQFSLKHPFERSNLEAGLLIIAFGLFKKTLVADPIDPFVNRVFSDPTAYSTPALWVAAFLGGVQIYCDFAGYSDIAIGTARLLGFHIPINFRRPFFSTTLAEIWQRWHISLSTWLRDYIYIPLGGSRVSMPRAYANTFATMMISGVWHGADWSYVLWGFFHGAALILERLLFSLSPGLEGAYRRLPRFVQNLYPVFLFTIGVFLFRAKPLAGGEMEALDSALLLLKRAFSLAPGLGVDLGLSAFLPLFVLIAIEAMQEWKEDIFVGFRENRYWIYGSSMVVLALCFFTYSVSQSQPFVYFQF